MNLLSHYKPIDGDEVIEWLPHDQDEGFSVIRNYPTDISFIPVVNGNKKVDTHVLIKIGYSKSRINKNNQSALFLSVAKHSKYLSDHFRYVFEDPNSPTEASLNESKSSVQPVDLTEIERFYINLNDHSIFDSVTKKIISVNELVEYMYELHISTITTVKGGLLRSKILIQSKISEIVIPKTIDLLKNIIWWFFGQKIVVPDKNYEEGFFRGYSLDRLQVIKPSKLPFFSELKSEYISTQAVFLIVGTILTIWFLDLLNIRDMQDIVILIITTILIYIYHVLIPACFLVLINILIWIRKKVMFLKFKYK